jgi:enoyl-CoA hydratase
VTPSHEQLIFEVGDGIGVMTLNRPKKRNALSRALRREIVERLDQVADDDSVQVLVLTGADPAFCAGFDRSEFGAGADSMAEIFAESTAYHRRVYTFEKPIVAAVNGPALGGGCDLAALCDVRLAATTASFGQPQVRFGAPAMYGLMREVLPEGAAREMCLTGRRYGAAEAQAIGLVSRVVEPSELLETARQVAQEIATLPAGLARATKGMFVGAQPPLFQP